MLILRFDIPQDFIEALESIISGSIHKGDWLVMDKYMDSEMDIGMVMRKLTEGLGYDIDIIMDWLEGQRETMEEWGLIWAK